MRYYIDLWPRAKTCASLLGFLRLKNEEISEEKKVGLKIVSESPDANLIRQDIFLQEFYLHAFSLTTRDKENLLETKDGHTYLKIIFEEVLTPILLPWLSDQDQRKWFHKVRRNVKKLRARPSDEFETDFIDLDHLLSLFCEEFKLKKKLN